MATTIRSLFLLLLVYSAARAGGNAPITRFEVQQQLLSATITSDAPPALFPDGTPPKKKSTGLAAIYSLLLPGMGELYADGFESGKYFLVAEGVLWLGYAAMEVHGNEIRDDSRAFARAHAGINPAGKEDQYFVDIGNFLNVYDFNDKKLRDREPEKMYNPNSDYAWQWDSDLSRATFRDKRVASDNMYNNQKFVFAALLINHVASAINAVRSAIAYNKALDETLGSLDLHATVQGGFAAPHGITLTLSRKF
jgi:hypothetical protein